MQFVLSPNDVFNRGLDFVSFENKRSTASAQDAFRCHYGSSPAPLAAMWADLCETEIPESRLKEDEKCERGFKSFMFAHHYLWMYPKNRHASATRFQWCSRNCYGIAVWGWVEKIAGLKGLKVAWPADIIADPNGPRFVLSLDGTDCAIWEPKHPTLPKDNKQCSFKLNCAAWKYEIGLLIHSSQVAWINGPIRGGQNDLEMFREGGLKDKIPDGKLVMADRGYKSSRADEEMLAIPLGNDSDEMKQFRARVQMRHESFNGRIKKFACLCHKFRHGKEKHALCFEAVVVIVQYQMEYGSPLFSVF